jgi:hypothetical protein
LLFYGSENELVFDLKIKALFELLFALNKTNLQVFPAQKLDQNEALF